MLIAELPAGEIARALGLPMPEIVFAELDPDFMASGRLPLELTPESPKLPGEFPVCQAVMRSSARMTTGSPASLSASTASGSGSPRPRYDSMNAAATP